MRDWGKILVSTRLEKTVSAHFFQVWETLLQRGLRPGDGALSVRGHVAHKAQNQIVRKFLLETDCDTLLTLDSDADVPADFVEQFRSYEPGWEYDILQAFYVRRGWPPRAIWMKRNALGAMAEWFVTEGDRTEEVDLAGTHACLFRREVFERVLGDASPGKFEWFYYPRHSEESEDGAFSIEAQRHGFRIGATSAIRAGHISEITVNWDTYQDYLETTGRSELLQRFDFLARKVAALTGESPDIVSAKAIRSSENVREAWEHYMPQDAAAERAFYGAADNGYLYDLLWWNCQPFYERLVAPLHEIHGKRVLVIGAGLGTEADILSLHNQVAAFELPGILHEFLRRRFGSGAVELISAPTLAEGLAGRGPFDLIVAIDTIEHIHPDELAQALDALAGVLDEHGQIYAHNNFGQRDIYPMHHDHSAAWAAWTAAQGLHREGDCPWRR